MIAMRILLVDDHPIVRSGLRHLLEPVIGVQVVGEAGSGQECLQQAKLLQPDLVILDLEMPEMDGVQTARLLRASVGDVKILVFSDRDDTFRINNVFSLSPAGYLRKNEEPETIINAVQGIARGETGWISQQVVSLMMDQLNQDMHSPLQLTARESQVLEAIVGGKTNQEIAYSLEISIKTVEKYVFSILSKLGVASRVEAAVAAVKNGWIQ
jgi:DNA-binding NarL/FixJ family response regulator